MPFDPKNKQHVVRLTGAIQESRQKHRPFRERHFEAIKEMIGVYYGDQDDQKPNHLNLIEITTGVYLAQLAAQPPQIHIETPDQRIRPAGKKLETLVNAKLNANGTIFHSIQRCIKSSLFSMGIMKVGVLDMGQQDMDGYQFHITEPYMHPVLVDDWVQDMTARTWEELAFMGHRYQVEHSWAKHNRIFHREARKRITRMDDSGRNETGEQRLSTIQQKGHGADSGYMDMCELWDIYLPRENLLMTFADGEQEQPLRVVEWTGPDHGPFIPLFYNEVDGSAMPLPPAMMWMGMHKIINALLRKLDRQAMRQKTVGVTRGKDSKDAEKLRNANDGDIVPVNNPDLLQEFSTGGANQQSFALMLQLLELTKWGAGNLDTLGGLGHGAPTATQEMMLGSSASQRIAQMRGQVHRFVQQVLEDYTYYIWQDPSRSYPVSVEINDELKIQTQLTPEERDHDYFEHKFQLEPYSMSFRSPQEKLNTLMQLLTTVYLPAMPMLQQQGIEVDFQELVKLTAKYSSIPELERVLRFSNTEPQDQANAQGQARQAPQTTRTHERVNRSAEGNGMDQIIGRMMSQNPQPMGEG